MMNEFQRRILGEAAKFGGAAISNNDKMANTVNEATPFFMGNSGGGTMFGYSKHQFEVKMRQLLQKMGFEKGINKMDVTDKKMVLHFVNAAKARDFIITFNGLTKRQSKGSPATISTSFDKVKSPAGTNAIVTVDFSMLKTEGLENESHLFIVLESLHEEYVTEGGVKAALENFMYSLPKAAIAELKPLMKIKGGIAQQVMRLASVTAVLNKHGVVKKFMGFNTANLVNDYFDTFHGESVEVEGEQLSEEQQVIGKYRFTSFTEGSISGWTISVQNIGEVGFIEAPAKKNTRTSIAPHKVFKTKGQSEGNPKLVLIAYPDSSTRFVNDKEIRFAPRQLLKAVAMWMEKHGKVMTEETQFVENGEIEEAKEKYLTGPGKKDPKRLVGIYSSTGKWIKDMGSEKEAVNFVNKSWGESVEEETEVSEQFKAGDKVKVPHKGKMVSGKIVRFDDGGTSKAQQHGGGYVVDVGEPASILVPKQKVQKEETEVAEAKAPFPKPFKKGEMLWVPNRSGKMVKGELVSYETGKAVGGSFTLKLTGQPESGTVVVGAEALFKANPTKMLSKEETEVSEAVNIGTGAYQIQRSGSNWEVWRLSYSQGSVRFADGRKGTKLRSDFKTYEDALAYAKKDAGVKEEVEIEEGVRIMTGAETMIKNAGGSSMVSNFRKIKSQLGAKPVGSVIVLTTEKDPESHEIKVYDPKDFQNMVKGLTKKAEAKVGSKGSWSDGEVTVIGIKESVELQEKEMIRFKRILQGVKDIQGPFTIVVMKASGPGALMQQKVSGAAAIPAHINHMIKELKGKPWKAIAIENAKGGVVNVLFPKDIKDIKEEVELELDEDNWGESIEESKARADFDKIRTNGLLARAMWMKRNGKSDTQIAAWWKEQDPELKKIASNARWWKTKYPELRKVVGESIEQIDEADQDNELIAEAYISTEGIAEIRNQLKKKFPQFKFEVKRTTGSYGSVTIYIISGPVKFMDKDGEINHYHLDFYKNSGTLKKILDVINQKNWDRSDIMTDYFDVGYYVYLHQGRNSWNGKKRITKPYFVKTTNTKAVSESWWSSSTLSKKDADSLLDDLESAYKKGGLRGQFKVPNGDSGPVWEMIDGLKDYLSGEPKDMIAYVLKGVKDFLSPTDRNDSRIKKVFEWFDEDGETISEAVSATKEYRQKKIQANRRLIVKLGTAAQKIGDTDARREITQTLSTADSYNRKLGGPEMMKSGPAYWVNFEGIYVGRELGRVEGLLKHHGITV